jgi:spermidine synthase
MPTSLFIEQHINGLAFYINGDLQFDSADEAIYHEYLVVPAIALAIQRFPETSLRVLICGGGDGLAARDVLRFSQVAEVTLVDYSAEVLELGKTVFSPYNQGSLLADSELAKNRVVIHAEEAFQFVSQLPEACFHAVICDFTYPTRSQETEIYSREWFGQIERILLPNGVISTNAVSPEENTQGFWCLYQTLFAAGFIPKPLQIQIPSFQEHDYGNWGFLLAAKQPIARAELEAISLPDNLQVLRSQTWLTAFQFNHAIARDRHAVNIHSLEHPQLFYYLLNPQVREINFTTTIDFLDVHETGTGLVSTQDLLQLESMAQFWLEQFQRSQTDDLLVDQQQLVPVQHRYHSPNMTVAWLGYVKSLLGEIDANQLLPKLLERAQELPPQLGQELKQLAEKVRTKQPIAYASNHAAELVTILSVSLLMANLAMPDAVFAKGYSRSSYSGGSYSSGYDSGYSGTGQFGWLGFWMMVVGGFWLRALSNQKDD